LKILIGVEQILPAAGAESVPPMRGRLAAGPLDACVRPGSFSAEPEVVPSGGEDGMYEVFLYAYVKSLGLGTEISVLFAKT
jgi:hypothetical protein